MRCRVSTSRGSMTALDNAAPSQQRAAKLSPGRAARAQPLTPTGLLRAQAACTMRTIASVREKLAEGMAADARQSGICKARRERIMFDSHSQVDARRAAEEESAADEVEVRCPPPGHAPCARRRLAQRTPSLAGATGGADLQAERGGRRRVPRPAARRTRVCARRHRRLGRRRRRRSPARCRRFRSDGRRRGCRARSGSRLLGLSRRVARHLRPRRGRHRAALPLLSGKVVAKRLDEPRLE